MPRKQKILIDMDIGDDIDDAIALYAAMQQGFEIVGITTVFRNTVERARQAKKMLKAYANGYENVPVYAGYGNVLGTEPSDFPHIPHYTPDIEADAYAPNGQSPEDAVNFIVSACKTYGKDLTVVSIGPFTNIAKAIEQDAQALNAINGVMIMGGAYFKQYADWNVLCDPKAADILFRKLDRLSCIGADVTHEMIAEESLYNSLLQDRGKEGCRRYLYELCQLWRIDRPRARLMLHDPLVIYALADPTLCKMTEASVVVLTDGYARGMTLNVDAYKKMKYNQAAYADFDASRKARVATAVNKALFDSRILQDCCVID